MLIVQLDRNTTANKVPVTKTMTSITQRINSKPNNRFEASAPTNQPALRFI